MADSKEDPSVEVQDTKIRERFFGAPGRSDVKQKQTGSSKSQKRSAPDDPVPADSYTSCKLDEPVRLRMADKGALAQKPMTVMTALQMTADRYHDQDAFAVKVDGKWQMTKLRDMYQMVRTVAKGFIRLGLTKYHSVVILGYNAPEWIMSYLAAICAGGVAVGLNYNYTSEECEKMASMVQCNIAVVDSAENLEKILQIRPGLPELVGIVHFGTEEIQKTDGVFSWNELIEMGKIETEDKLKERILSQAPNFCCNVSFTIGSSGPPKPVMLSHDNVIWTARLIGKYQSIATSGGAHLSFLPLSQPSGSLTDIIIPLVYATTVYFVPRKLVKSKLVDVMRDVRPTFFVGFSFIYEKIQARLQVKFDQGLFRRCMIKRAMKIGWKAYLNAKEGKPRPFGWWWANQFVFKKVQRRLGLDRCLEVMCGKSFLLDNTIEFFISLGITILNAYGTTELTAPHSSSLPERNRFGSCGVEMDGCHTRFAPIGMTIYREMRVKGRHVFMGYLNEPQMTADTFDDDGWYKTGDLGYKDEMGFLYTLGGVNDLIKMADGRVVAPNPIEQAVKNQLPFISHCIVYGQNKPNIVALLTLEAATDETTDVPLDVLSKRAEMWLRKMHVDIDTISHLAENPPEKLVSIIQTTVDKVNSSVPDNPFAIRNWRLLLQDFSFAAGELTPAHYLRRAAIHDLHAIAIENLYDGP